MIKLRKIDNSNWQNYINGKNIILCNDGIGDTIVCGNFAKHFNTSIIRTCDNVYKNEFSRIICNFFNIDLLQLPKSHMNFFKNNNKIVKQFDMIKHFGLANNDNLIHEILTQNHGITPTEKTNDVFICPNGSEIDQHNIRRFMTKDELNAIINNLKTKNVKIWLVGIEKDIEKYGHYQNCNWINSYGIISDKNLKNSINIKIFLQMIVNSKKCITVATSFEQICGMLKVDTITLHRFDKHNNPILHDHTYNYYFSNPKWYKTITKMTHVELNNYLQSF